MSDPIEKDTPETKIEAGDAQKTADKIMNGDTPDGKGKAAEPTKSAEPAKTVEPEKKAEPAKVEEPKFELKLQEGSLLDAGAIERTVAFAKEQGLSPKAAQAILDRESKLLASHAESQIESFNKLSVSWVDEIKNDKEIGGEQYAKNIELAKRVVDRFGSKAFKDGLAGGLGNNPELVRFAVSIGKAMDEDKLVLPGNKGSAATKEMADVFYGGTTKNE